ncbi:MAG: glycoside hydrolase family 16 protein [Clostridia bacterium]|nr:glycoside hydrolase family 16 protein [Clostridia bacterium]
MFKSLLAKLAVRQMSALTAIPTQFSKLPVLFFTGKLKQFFAAILAIFQLLGVIIFDTPGPVIGEEIDLSDYTVVFSDEFTGDSLNTDVWEGVPMLGTGEIFDESMLSFDGDNLIMSTQYLENGSQGAGWYTGGIENTDAFSNIQPGSYIECRCIVPAAKGMWSAFWLMTSGQKEYRKGINTDYTEIDVMESFYYGQKHQNSTINTVHKWQPETRDFKSEIVGKYRVDKHKDMYNEYVTYGVLWEEDQFIFYIDGKESGRTTNGATTDPAFMLLTCQVKLNDVEHPEILDNPESAFPAKFIVDYVRVYSKTK